MDNAVGAVDKELNGDGIVHVALALSASDVLFRLNSPLVMAARASVVNPPALFLFSHIKTHYRT